MLTQLNCRSLLLWPALYMLLGYFSLLLDDPASRVAFVWFPAGVAVSAFLSTIPRSWLALWLALFGARTLLDVLMRHSLETSLILSSISLTNDLSIAWCVRRFSVINDVMRRVVIWLFSTVLTSAVGAVLGVSWLSVHLDFPFMKAVWIWWAANVVGTIVITTALVGVRWEPEPIDLRKGVIAAVLAVAIALITIVVFGQPAGAAEDVAAMYALACLPIALTVLVPVLCGNRLGALVYTLFCSLVIVCSWQETGPFFIGGLNREEPLLLAQCYLSGTALLMIFIRIQKRILTHERDTSSASPMKQLAYHLDVNTGVLTWNPHAESVLSTLVAGVRHTEQLMALLTLSDRERLEARWAAVIARRPVDAEFRFQLNPPGVSSHIITEHNLLCLPSKEGNVIVGYWTEIKGAMSVTPEQEF